MGDYEIEIDKRNDEPNFKNLYFEHMNKTKISYDYICMQLESVKECYEIEKMTTKILEAMIDRLVEDEAKEIANMIDKVKYHSQEYKIIKKSNKLLIDKSNRL